MNTFSPRIISREVERIVAEMQLNDAELLEFAENLLCRVVVSLGPTTPEGDALLSVAMKLCLLRCDIVNGNPIDVKNLKKAIT